MKLYKHQKKIVDTIPDKYGLWLRMRVGKTPTSIRLACTRSNSAIIICPKSIVSHWEKEIGLWRNSECEFLVISREQFRKRYKELPKMETIIYDEAHIGIANYKSQVFKAVDAYAKHYKVKYLWLLTGTAYTSTPWCVFSYAKILGKDWNWFKYRQAFFNNFKIGTPPRPGQRDTRKVISTPKKTPAAEKKLQELIRKLGVVVDIKDVMDVIPDEDSIEYFEMNAEQKRLQKEYVDPMAIVQYTKWHQIESGVVKGDGYIEDKIFPCPKDKRVEEICAGNDKTIIVCRFRLQIAKYKEMLAKLNIPIFVIMGGEKLTASEVSELAEKEERAIVLVQGDTVAGYSLESFNLIVFASMSYSFVCYDQVRFRTKSMEKKVGNYYIHLLTKGESIDNAVYNSVIHKQDFSEKLYSSIKK